MIETRDISAPELDEMTVREVVQLTREGWMILEEDAPDGSVLIGRTVDSYLQAQER